VRQADRFAPRALLARPMITIDITPSELWLLIEAMEAAANRAAEDSTQIDFADYLYRRIAELREAAR
jgi:hypothetical protein